MYLTDLWHLLPERLFAALLHWLDITREAAHEELCAAWGCRCPEDDGRDVLPTPDVAESRGQPG